MRKTGYLIGLALALGVLAVVFIAGRSATGGLPPIGRRPGLALGVHPRGTLLASAECVLVDPHRALGDTRRIVRIAS